MASHGCAGDAKSTPPFRQISPCVSSSAPGCYASATKPISPTDGPRVKHQDEKERALVMMVDRLFPGRTAQLRQSWKQEIKATAVIFMDIEKASAKIRAKGVADDEEDYALPIYAERLPVRTILGTPEACPRLLSKVERPDNLAAYRPGRPLEER